MNQRSLFFLGLFFLLGCDDPTPARDAGRLPDADVAQDAGPLPDAGPPPDAGMDAGTDAGAPTDAGTDAAVEADAGMGGTGLPLDHLLPESASGTSATRLGNEIFVLAYADNIDSSTREPEAIVLQRVRRSGHALLVEAPQAFMEPAIDPGTDAPIHLMGSLGPDHFFLIVQRPTGEYELRWFRDDAGVFTDLGTLALGGSEFGGPPGFFNGHPVDDRRHLLAYRESDSSQPLRYRLILRDGDSLRLGPPVTRPSPSAFPGLDIGDSRSDPALSRVGPTTFVELRPGYVLPPGYLATWILEVMPDDSLSASDPRVHDGTVMLSYNVEVGSDGRGGALTVYHGYRDTDWRYAVYDHGARTLIEGGMAGMSETSSIRAHQGESTDRYLGGAYYLRLIGGPDTPAPLLRIDARDGRVARIGDTPDLWHCYRAPQMVRAGTIAAYPGCDRVLFLDLLPGCGDGRVEGDEACDDGNNDDGDGCSAGCTIEP